ncbi:MAG TPA: flagellin [Alphaproteobacteria bacterium]|nr:flagellin [Alphaproteobacteria bacterium]
MSITFNTNLAALGTQRSLGIAAGKTQSSLAKLSSGSRVPTAKDDAAGLAVGTQLKAEVAGLNQASLNAAQAVSVLQIADGALSTISDMLTRMKTLAVQAASGQLSDNDRGLLNSEFLNLRTEVDRISGITSFNGTALLAGSSSVSSSINGLGAYNANNDTAATTLLDSAHGIADVQFSQSYGDGAIKISYDSTGGAVGNLIVKDLVNNKSQTITVANGAIAAGSTETYSFGELGVTVTLNSNFNKGADLAAQNSANVSSAPSATAYTGGTTLAGGTTVVNVTDGVTINALSFNDTETGPYGNARLFADQIFNATRSFTVNSGTDTAVTLNGINVTVGGVLHTFTSASSQSFVTTGDKDYVFSDGQGNSFTLRINLTTGSGGSQTITGGVTIGAGTTGGQIENTGSAFNGTRPAIIGVTEATTEGSRFNFGTVNNSRLVIDASTAATSALSIVINGQTFTTANTTGGASGAVDMTTTGIKTVTLANTNVAATANTITIQYNVTRAFADGDAAQIVLGDAGQLVGSDSITSGTTSFSFKVGTGSTASSANNDITFNLNSATTSALGIGASTIDTASNANAAIDLLTTAISTVSTARANVGANQSRLDFAKASVDVTIQNTTAAQSGLLDVDVSAEITNFTSQQVLLQAGVSLLAQANQQPALLLRLLQ